MLRSPRFARASYVLFAVAVLAVLMKLGSASGAEPFILRMMPVTPVAKANEPAVREVREDEPLDLPENEPLTFAGHPLTGLTGRSEEEDGDAPVFYRPSPGSTREADGDSSEPVCKDLGDFPRSSRAVFPLPEDFFDSYEDTWGAPRPQGGHEGSDLMSPTGIPEFAITDGTIVPVSGANKNGWNRLGGYTVMVEAAYDIGPIKKGDLFYYAHMDRESALPIGTKVRAGQRIGAVGDTGEGREATRGNFPPHLHLGWYDAGADGDRTVLESGAMSPYPLLVWLEESGGAVSGGNEAASYCEAPREPIPEPSTSEGSWHTPEFPGTRPDLDTGSAYDPRPSPAVEESRQRRRDRSPERESGSGERGESGVFGGRISAAAGGSNMVSTGDPEGNDGTEDVRDGIPASDVGKPESSEDQASRPPVEDVSLEAKTRKKSRSLPTEPRPDQASRPSYASALADTLQKKKIREDRDGKNAGKKDLDGEDRSKARDGQDKKKQDEKKKRQKKPTNLLKSKEPDQSKPVGSKENTLVTEAVDKDTTSSINTQQNKKPKTES